MTEWMPAFATRRSICVTTENKPYLEWLDGLGVNDEDDTTTMRGHDDQARHSEEDFVECDEGTDAVRKFMRGGQKSLSCLPQADKVEDFCRGCVGASLQAVRSGSGRAALQPVAWLEERGCEGARPDSGHLTAFDLYLRLKRPVKYRQPSQTRQLTCIISASRTLRATIQVLCLRTRPAR
jgi:hypothetical protein